MKLMAAAKSKLAAAVLRRIARSDKYTNLFIKLLRKLFELRYQEEWVNATAAPHFYDQRHNVMSLAFGNAAYGPYVFYRGFYTSEVIEKDDKVLDIGSGDGFFTMRFYATKASKVDGIDIEDSAIEMARTTNQNSKTAFLKCDAIREPFPDTNYDVIVFDGAIGHISKEDSKILLKKIKDNLSPTGIFVGSESLGHEGHDHLQFFDTLDDLKTFFLPYFSYISFKSIDYNISASFQRKEAYWRCSNAPERIEKHSWKNI